MTNSVPDDERARWVSALERIANRIRTERGVEEPVDARWQRGRLWGHYGDLQILLSGPPGPDEPVTSEDALFRHVDAWVAFDRDDWLDAHGRVQLGAGRILDRDRDLVRAWRHRLPQLRDRYQLALELLLADVERTTDLRPFGQVTVNDDAAVKLRPWDVSDDLPVEVRSHHSDAALEERPLEVPGLWFEFGDDTHVITHALPDADSTAECVQVLAAHVTTWMVDMLFRAWPECPHHAHPLEIDAGSDPPQWICPRDVTVPATPIGSLASP